MDRDKLVIPRHIAIIMDGNGRWAKERGKIRLEGHRAGAASLERILRYAGEIGVKYLTVYAFSTENWKRPQKEVNGLMDLFGKYLDKEKKNLKKQGVKLVVTGEKENISPKLLKKIEDTQKFLEDCEKITFNIAFNYGGRREIVSAVNKILSENETKKIEKITEEGPYFSNGLASSVNKSEPSILQYIANAFSNREYEVLVQELHHVDGKWTFSSSVSFLSKIRKDHKETLEAQCVFEVVNGKPSALQYLTIKKNTRLNKSINGFSGHEEKINL